MHAFRRLFVTELRNRRNMIFGTISAGMLLYAALTLFSSQLHLVSDELDLVVFLNIVIFVALLLIPFVHCFSIWLGEWKRHSIYHLLSLPVPRAYLLLSKYASILLEVLLISAVTVVWLWIQYEVSDGLLFRAEPLVTFEWSKLMLLANFFLTATSLVFLCSLSVLLGKWLRKFAFLASLLAFVVGLFLGILVFANFPSFLSLVFISLLYFGANYYLLEYKAGV